MFLITDLIDYYIHPKYVVMRGIEIDNRAIMFLGANPVFTKDEYGNKVMRFSNCKYEYYKDRIHTRIWSFKGLINWRRMVGSDTKFLQKVSGKWIRLAT